MKWLLIVAILFVAAGASGQTSVEAISDAQLTFSCLSFGGQTGPSWLSFNGGSYHNRAVMVFDKQMFPVDFGVVALEVVAPNNWQNSWRFRMTAYTSDDPMDYAWEYQIERMLFIGEFETPAHSGPTTFQYDISGTILDLTEDPGRYIHLKLSSIGLLCSQNWCNGSFAGLNNVDGNPGPKLVFESAIPTEKQSLGGLKGSYR